MTTGKELVLKALKDKGVRYVFGYTGGAIMPIFDEMERQKCFTFIMARHEQGAAFMAQGISRASQSTSDPQIGVCMATSGPGAMNLVTAVADAMMDSVPLLAVTGQVATGVIATDAFQESDVVGVMMPLTKQTYMPLSADTIEETIHEAIYVAMTGRGGPVLVDIPKDVQTQAVAEGYRFEAASFQADLPGFYYSPAPEREAFRRAVALVNQSERPIILCGHGVTSRGAGDDLRVFAEKARIPIAFTLHGLSALPVDHPLSLGMVGMHGTVEANRALLHADLILSLGMRFDDRVTGKLETFAPNAKVIHVEIDPSEIDKNVPTMVALNADVGEVLRLAGPGPADHRATAPRLVREPRRLPPGNRRRSRGRDRRRHRPGRPTADEVYRASALGNHRRQGHHRLRRGPAPDDPGALLQLPDAQQLVYFGRRRHHGLRPAHGRGRQAGPARRTRVGGHGRRRFPDESPGTGRRHGVQDRHQDRAAQQRLPGHGAPVADPFLRRPLRRHALKSPDFGLIAQAYGIPFRRVTDKDEVAEALRQAAEHPGAFMLELRCDPSEIVLPMVPSGGGIADMIVSKRQIEERR